MDSGEAVSGVVVGMSLASACPQAVRWASREAALRGLPLTLLHAWALPVEVTVPVAPGLLPDVDGASTASVRTGRAAEVLLGHGADLLVLGAGRHGRGVVGRVLRRSRCPVVTVPPTDRAGTGLVVVGVCGTPASDAALRWAAQQARLHGSRLQVVHAWQVHPTSVRELLRPGDAVVGQAAGVSRQVEAWAAAVLGAAAPEVVAVHGPPLEGLCDASAQADLLVLGRGLHGLLARVLGGAVATDLSALARCPVAVVPT